MTATNNPTPTELVQAGKEAFAAGKQAATALIPSMTPAAASSAISGCASINWPSMRPRAA